MQTIILNIGGMSCQGCADSVTKALNAVAGVGKVQVDWATGLAEIAYDAGQTRAAALLEAVENAGFDAAVM